MIGTLFTNPLKHLIEHVIEYQYIWTIIQIGDG